MAFSLHIPLFLCLNSPIRYIHWCVFIFIPANVRFTACVCQANPLAFYLGQALINGNGIVRIVNIRNPNSLGLTFELDKVAFYNTPSISEIL